MAAQLGYQKKSFFSKEKRATQVIQQHNDPKYQSKYKTEWLKRKETRCCSDSVKVQTLT